MPLILSRKAGPPEDDRAVFYIGDDVVVTVLGCNRGKVKLSIDAPADVLIVRRELRNRSQPQTPQA